MLDDVELMLLHVHYVHCAGSPLPLSGKRFTPAQLVDSLKHPTVSKLQRGSPYAFATDSNRRRSQGTRTCMKRTIFCDMYAYIRVYL